MNPKFPYLFLFLLAPICSFGQVKIENYSLTKPDTNLLYIGIENKIHVSGLKNNTLTRIKFNGRFYPADKNGLFYVTTSGFGPGLLQVFLNSEVVASENYYSNRISDPTALLDNYRDTSISKFEITRCDGLKVIMPNCLLSYKLSVGNFTITLISKNRELNVSNNISGNKITDTIKRLINKLESGDKIIFDNIRIVGPDDTRIGSFFIIVK